MDTAQTRAWLAEFEAASKRSLETRLNYAFIKTYKPVTRQHRRVPRMVRAKPAGMVGL